MEKTRSQSSKANSRARRSLFLLSPIVMCLKKDNTALCAELEKALDALKESGKLDEIALKYFGTTDVIPSN